MKRFLIVVTILTIYFTLSSQVKAVENSYTKAEIVLAKWGQNKNEFAIPYVQNNMESGPKYFTISNKNQIFVLDAVEKSILVFDKGGKYIRTIKLEVDYDFGTDEMGVKMLVDSEDYIYIFPTYWQFFVDKFNKDGKLIKRYILKNINDLHGNIKSKYIKFKKFNTEILLVTTVRLK